MQITTVLSRETSALFEKKIKNRIFMSQRARSISLGN